VTGRLRGVPRGSGDASLAQDDRKKADADVAIVRTRSPRAMNWWRPPEYGPVKSSRRSDVISFRRLTGPQGGISWLA